MMKQKLLIIIIISLFITLLFCESLAEENKDNNTTNLQHEPSIEYERILVTEEDNFLYSAIQTEDNGFLITGQKEISYKEYCWIVKLSPDLNETWNKTLKLGSGASITKSNMQGYLISGITDDTFNDTLEFWIINIDEEGNKIWNVSLQKYYELGSSQIRSMSTYNIGKSGYVSLIYLWESSSGVGEFKSIETDNEGKILKSTIISRSSERRFSKIIRTLDNGFIIADLNDGLVLTKLDSNYNEEWNNTYPWGLEISSIAQSKDGGYYIAGHTMTSMNGFDYFISRVDKNGNEEWKESFHGKGSDSVDSIVPTDDNGVLVVGVTHERNSEQSPAYDFWIVRLNENGEEQWQLTYDSGNNDSWANVIRTFDGGYLVFGRYWFNVTSYGLLVKISPDSVESTNNTNEEGEEPETDQYYWIIIIILFIVIASVIIITIIWKKKRRS